MTKSATMLLATVGLAVVSQGCLLAAAGGAAAGVHLTSRGAESVVERSIGQVEAAVRASFDEWGIALTGTSTEDNGAKREFKGEVDDLDVSVTLEIEDPGTNIDISARRSALSWDKDYAQRLLARILAAIG